MACRLDPKEIEKLEFLLNELYTWDVDYWVERAIDIWGTEEAGERAREWYERKIANLIDKLRRGECPTRSEKDMIREACLCCCTEDQKEMLKRIFPKLKMRWTRDDEAHLCRIEPWMIKGRPE